MPAAASSFPQKMLSRAKTMVSSKKQDKTTKEIEHPEFVHLSSDCKIVKNSLEALSKQMHENEKHWAKMCENQKEFADCYGKLFYDNNDLKHIAVQWKETSDTIDADIKAHFEKQDSPHKALKAQVHAKIDELTKVLARRAELRRMMRQRNKARKDLDKAKANQPALDGPNEAVAAKQRAFDDAETLYSTTLASVIETMKALLAAANTTYACAFSEFCWVSTHASSIVEYSMSKMRSVADSAVNKLIEELPPILSAETEQKDGADSKSKTEDKYYPVNDDVNGDARSQLSLA